MIANTRRRLRKLFEAADDKLITMPDEVTKALRTSDRLTDVLLPEPNPGISELYEAAVEAALSSDNPAAVDVAPIVAHEVRLAEWNAAAEVLRRAAVRADQDLSATVTDLAELIITQHIRPAGDKLYTRILTTISKLGDTDTDSPSALLRAPDPVRKAWLELDDLAVLYFRLRSALDAVPVDPPEHDVHADHAEYAAGLCTLLGANYRGQPMSQAPRRPYDQTDARATILWFARSASAETPWWPTSEQRDLAWLECHREAHEAFAVQQSRHGSVHARG